MIEVTPKAQEKLNAYMEQNDMDSPVRVFLSDGGCCGPALGLGLDEEREGDAQFNNEGRIYVIDKALSERIGKVTVDFVEQEGRAGFTVSAENPVSTGPSACDGGCCC